MLLEADFWGNVCEVMHMTHNIFPFDGMVQPQKNMALVLNISPNSMSFNKELEHTDTEYVMLSDCVG